MRKTIHTLNRRDFIKLTTAAGIASLLPGCRPLSNNKHPNVLFVIVDDLRPELGCYGNTEIKTPNFDRFAKESVVFKRAYCQAAACADLGGQHRRRQRAYLRGRGLPGRYV